MRATDSPAGVLVLSQHGNYPRNDIFYFDIIARFCRPIYCQELHRNRCINPVVYMTYVV